MIKSYIYELTESYQPLNNNISFGKLASAILFSQPFKKTIDELVQIIYYILRSVKMNSNDLDELVKQAKILVVDDISENIQLIGNILFSNQYQVLTANSGEQALKMVKAKHPDMILLDIQMPVMDGYDVIKELKKDPLSSEIPVIFLTARIEADDIVKGFNLGATDYINKPFKLEELLARIKTHLLNKFAREIIVRQNQELSEVNQDLSNALHTLQIQQEKMIEMERIKSVLAMAVTTNHELNQPLTVIQGNIEMLKIRNPELENDKYLQKVIESVDNIVKKLNKFSNFDRIVYKQYAENVEMIQFDKQ